MILYTENPKESKKILLELMNSEKLQHTKSTHKNQLYFYIPVMNNPKRK